MIGNIKKWLNNLGLGQRCVFLIGLVFLGVFLYGFIDFEGMLSILETIFKASLFFGFIGLILFWVISGDIK